MIGIPYIAGLSEKLQHIFKVHRVNMYHKPSNKLRDMLVHNKDPTPNTKKMRSYLCAQMSSEPPSQVHW